MTEGLSAFGAKLKWNGVNLAELTGITGPSMAADTLDTTSHDSADGFREFIAGLRDGGSVTIEGYFIPGDTTGQVAMITDFQAGTKRQAIVTGPTDAAFTLTFNALVTALEIDEPFDGKIGFSATLKVSGKPVLGITYAPNLTGLTITTATLYPTFAGGVYAYTATTTGTSVTVTPTCGTADSITVNGNVVVSGQPSSAISAGAVGANTAIQVRVKKAGCMDRVYDNTLVKTA